MSFWKKDLWRGLRGVIDVGAQSYGVTIPRKGADPLETYEKPSYKSGSGAATGGIGIIIIAAVAAVALGWIKL